MRQSVATKASIGDDPTGANATGTGTIPLRLLFIGIVAVVGCHRVMEEVSPTRTQLFTTSYYGEDFADRPTASGEIFEPSKLTAAHKELPFGTILDVRNPETGKSVRVRINDRGPFIEGRDLDLSSGAAKQIGLTGVEVLEIRVVE